MSCDSATGQRGCYEAYVLRIGTTIILLCDARTLRLFLKVNHTVSATLQSNVQKVNSAFIVEESIIQVSLSMLQLSYNISKRSQSIITSLIFSPLCFEHITLPLPGHTIPLHPL